VLAPKTYGVAAAKAGEEKHIEPHALPRSQRPAAPQSDAVLRNLWSEYLVLADARDKVAQKYATARASYDAERPPCPDGVLPGDHHRAYEWLWQKHGLEQLWDAADAAHDRMDDIVKGILCVEATSLFGIGVKLAALPGSYSLSEGRSNDPEDYVESVASVLSDINRLIGTDFVGVECEQYDEEEEAEAQS
jgi:hypothetical protein